MDSLEADVVEAPGVAVSNGERLPEETWPDVRPPMRTFFGAPIWNVDEELTADVAFLGIPYDFGSGVVSGARLAPDAVRAARMYSVGPDTNPTGYYDIDGDRQALAGVTMVDCGDVPIIPGDVERNLGRMTRAVRSILSHGPLLVSVGGDHSITGPVVRGFDAFPALDVVHFDAHHDYVGHTQGVLWGHGSPMRRVSEFAWVRNITQVGIRVSNDWASLGDSRARGNRIVSANQFRELGPEASMDVVPEAEALYVTIDVDVLDPSVCPGAAVPEAGGLTYLEMRAALRALAKRGRIVGIDLVEIAPPRDVNDVTAKTGARLVIDLLTAIFDSRASARMTPT